MKKRAFSTLVREFAHSVRSFGPGHNNLTLDLLNQLAGSSFGRAQDVARYHDALLFSVAYPQSPAHFDLSSRELHRVAEFVSTRRRTEAQDFLNSGIAGCTINDSFSLELNAWLLNLAGERVHLDLSDADRTLIASTLSTLLDPVEFEMSSADPSWSDWISANIGSRPDDHQILRWIVDASGRLPGNTSYREMTFSRFRIRTTWKTLPRDPVITLGRAPYKDPCIVAESLIRHVDLEAELRGTQPTEVSLSTSQRTQVIELSRGVLASRSRETDPSTYANVDELTYLDMGRGLTIALMPMISDMKMAIQSYVGYMAFRNGVPCAYGGGWLLFGETGFGVNVYEPFRGGESAWIVAQLMKAYHSVFHVSSFTIDPYQIGLGNPDAIASGAFWFYYRLGFRPQERVYRTLASAEWKKMMKDPTYRSSREDLRKLANASMRWTLKDSAVRPIIAERLSEVVAEFIREQHGGDRHAARMDAMKTIERKTDRKVRRTDAVSRIAVLLAACGYVNAATLQEIVQFARDYEVKQRDETQYVRLSQRYTLLIDLISNLSNDQ